ncbi:MAG TPA: amino acid adenylation domain-containing protein, partial [Pyrinomonadaceae bacterium]
MKSGHHLIGLMTGESPKLLVGMLAILKSGAGFVPIDPAYPQERISFIVQDCGLETLLTESRYLELARRIAETHASLKRIVCLDDLTVEEVKPAGVEIHDRSDWLQRPATNVVARVEPEQTVYVIYTSGSTGQPKGVPISHRNLVPLLLWSREFFNLGEHTKALQNLSYCFDFGVFEILTTVVFGGTLYFPGTNGSHKTSTSAAYVEEHAINTIHTTPSYFREIISLGGTLKSLETLHLGGEALTKSTVDYIFDVVDDDCTVYNGYGPTEASVNCSIMKVGTRRAHWHDEHSSVPIGRVSANNQLYVLDKNCEPVPVGVAGELHVGGAGLAAGYLNRPQLTAEKFIPHPFTDEPGARLYRSGDLARYHLDGNIEFLGRLDDQIKVRGYRIELGEIEAALAQHPSVAEAVVMPHDGATGARRLVAYLVHKQGENGATVGELRSFLKAKLPEYMVPSAFMKLESLPLTSSGKIDRRALPAPDQSRPELEEAFEAPRSLVEEVIAGICGEVLGIERVGVNDNLFDLGCHSLLATKIVARVREAVGVELALTSFFESPTVAELTAICDEAKLAETNLQLPPIRHAERNNGHLPLSFAQERIWFLDQLTSHNTSYYIPRALRIKGPLNVKVVEDTFTELLRRHEILRTSFPAVEGRPVQVIHPPEPFHATLIDLRHLADDERESKVRQIILEEGQRTFDLAVAPLLRVTLLRVEQDEFVLILTEHHLIHDGWTQGILLGEFLTLYTSLAAGEPSPLPELPVQYADFAVWQRQWWQGEFLETQLAYWKKQLSGAPPLLELPIDRPRPPMQSFRGAEQSMHISAELAESLRALSRQEGVTVFMVMLAAFKVLLSRYSGQEDILVGTGIANRRSREMEGMLGMIINTVVMRTDLSGNITFRELLKRVRQVCLDAYAHQDMPFEKLVEELQPQRSLSYMPLFQVFFGFLDTPMRNMELPGLTLELMEAHNNSAKFDLNVIFILHAEQRIGITDDPVSHEITGLFEYNTDIFKDETITRLVRHYQTLLESVVANPEQPLADLELLPPDERHLMLNEWNQTAKDYSQDKCIHQLFERQVEKSPDAAAVIFEDVELTYTELNRRANQLAHQLRALGIKRGDYVAILAERSLEMVVSVLGITKAGAAYVPLDPAWPEDRLRWMLSSLGVKCILTQTPQLRTIHNLRWQLPSLAHVVLLDTDTPRPPSEKIDREAVEALWNHVAEQSSSDRVLSGGFVSSYTGEAFAEAAVAEYVNRVVKLAEPYLGADKKVLEIGCGAGHIMFEVAPRVAHYTGLDPSAAMQALNRVYADEHGHSNVELLEGFAEQTDSLEAGSYDLVIIASVAQFFPGAVYFTEVIEKSLRLLNAGGTILLADIMDARRKDEFKKSLLTFKSQNPDANTKTQLESELYFEENFFQELQSELPSLDSIEIRRRDEGFANELGYRFDVLLKKTETVADANEQPRQDSRQTNLLTLWHLSSMPEDNPQISVTAEDVAYIIFTSGSTGLPKGVVVQHKPVINLIEWVNGEFQVGAGDVLLFVTSLCFDLSVYDIFGTLAAGATIRVASSKDLRDPQRLVRMLRQEGITFWDSAPAALQHLSPFLTAVNPQEDASRLRLAFLSGDWIPLGLPDLVRSAFPGARVISLGGATEATIWSNFFPIGGIEPHWVSIPYGKPIQNARYHVLDAQLDPSPIGVPGDLYIGGDCLALGYTDAELTARKFIPNPFSTEPGARLYSTGDRARYWPDGNLEFLGRLDSQVKIRGYRIELGEIEAALVSHPAIRECLAMSREDVPGDKRLVAYFICHKDATTPTLADLRAHVREKLPEYMVPAAFVELESIPLTPNGKVDRRALPAPEQNRAETGIEYAAPRTPIEEMLAGIWSEVLGVEQVGIHDNFFELGGHSLLASRLLSRARANFALELPLRALFESPTVSTLASQIETSLRSAHAHDIPPLRRVEREGNLPLSFAQQRLWFIDQLEPSSTAYNIASGVRLLGPLHSSALQQSLQHIVRRHEVLRTSFSTLHGEPVQLIAPSLDFHMEMSDLSTLTEEERARQSQELMEEEAGKAFDLSKSPLMRARLMKMGEEEHVLLLTMHHIISDGWSMG